VVELKYKFDTCKICDGAIKILREKTVDGLTVARCAYCGLDFVTDIPVSLMWTGENPEGTINYYSHIVSKESNKFHYGLSKILGHLDLLNKVKGDMTPYTILDVGCGDGRFLSLCKNKGFIIAGIELDRTAADLCEKRGLENIHVKDIENIEDSFNIITLFDVAEHLEDLKDFFKKIHDRLTPGGIVYIETPRRSILDFYINVMGLVTHIKSNRINRAHLQLFTNKSLEILLEGSGFDVIFIEKKQSLSWANRKQYIHNLGIKSDVIASLLTKIADFFISLKLLGNNKAIVLAQKNITTE
jgi:2-polyprenyl-3-methyl-5-hydroxy-6-metoxy-1,4-benzoquinol methylase